MHALSLIRFRSCRFRKKFQIHLSSLSKRLLHIKMPSSGTALDKFVKEDIENFRMKQGTIKCPWMLLEIVPNDDGIDVVKVTKKATPEDSFETLQTELKDRAAVYFVLDYAPTEEQVQKYNIPKNRNFPLTCFWSKEAAKPADKMKYSATVGTLKSATNSIKTYIEAHDLEDLCEEAIWEKVKIKF